MEVIRAVHFDNSKKSANLPFGVMWWTPVEGKKDKQWQKGLATKEEADAKIVELMGATDHLGGNMTVQEYTWRWHNLTASNKTAATLEGYVFLYKRHIFPAIGDVPLNKLTRPMCEDFLLGPRMTRSVALKVSQLLGAILNNAEKSDYIRKNPARGIKIAYKAVKEAEIVPITYAQLKIVELYLEPYERLAMWIMYGEGTRIAETLGLKTTDIIKDGTRLRVKQTYVPKRLREANGGNSKAAKWRQKGDPAREIPLYPWLYDMIQKHIKEFHIPKGGWLFPGFMDHPPKIGCTYNAFWRHMDAGKKVAGVPELHPHAFRHYFASTNLTSGRVSLPDVSRWLGHQDYNTTYKMYNHMVPDAIDVSREVGQDAFEEFREDVTIPEDVAKEAEKISHYRAAKTESGWHHPNMDAA